MNKAYLILADGTIFEGQAIGAQGKTIGEVVFTTGMTGYLETLTDPSYYGQIVTQTFPLIGNYGVIPEDFESAKSWVRGYIVREMCDDPSNFRCQGNLDAFLKAQGIVGICGIDTRALTKKLRESGVMNGMIVSGEDCPDVISTNTNAISSSDVISLLDTEILKEIKEYKITDAVKSVSHQEKNESVLPVFASQKLEAQAEKAYGKNTAKACAIVLFDFGAKANIQRELEKRGCKVTIVSYNTSAQEIIKLNPDGIMLSNGPGDPAENTGVIEEIRKLCEWNKKIVGSSPTMTSSETVTNHVIPIFGICLGHQMLALARGAKTNKLKYGHRGGNHPCKDLLTNRVYITSQNHGYAVEATSLPPQARLSFINVNDNTCEGIEYRDIPAFSVQFHPEACGGPHDTNFLFDRFLKMMEAASATK